MAIKATCASCGSVYNVGDQLAGKKIKCKKCEATIPVPAENEADERLMDEHANDEERRKKKSSDNDIDDEPDDSDERRSKKKKTGTPQKGSNKTLFIILGVVGGLLLLCCGGSVVGFIIVANKASDAAKDFAKKFEEEMKKAQKARVVIDEKVIGKLVLNQNDKINPNDPDIAVERANGFSEKKKAKAYNVQFTQGKTYIINMKQSPGSPLDPLLVLADPKGKWLASDDDGGGYPNARISHVAEMNGQYRITATSFGNSSGEYTLTVEER